MPTSEHWVGEHILSTTWTAPLTSSEVSLCFNYMAGQIEASEKVVHLFFDIKNAGVIPAQAPMHFVKSQIASQPYLGSIAVYGTNPVAQILAQIVIKTTGQNILFFADEAEALDYLRSS